jgi:chloramphenicol 3-O phosphotransferase
MLPDVIILNGASSSGKTSVAKALQELMPVLYLNFSIDSVLYALPQSELTNMIRGAPVSKPEYDYDTLVRGYHASAAALLGSGNRLILDNAITKVDWRRDLAARLKPFQAVWVGVECSASELRAREERRGDRALGTAEREAALVHEHVRYDLVIDTSSCSSQQCASQIISALC